jgi:eukaryotic-like serine/threonine-protein kinase
LREPVKTLVPRRGSSTSRRERRLEAAIAEYLQANPTPDRRVVLERHPDVADGLASFFANEDRLKHLVGLVQPAGGMDDRPRDGSRWVGLGVGLAPGREVGEYELLNEVASGGMGLVFKARHRRLNRIVALKTIRPGVLPPKDETLRRLRFEAEVVASLDHPNIVPLYEVGEHGGCPYLVLKFITGGDLERHAPRLRGDTRATARLMARVARTVHYAHRRGVLHCDLKPSNVLLDAGGEPHITDFGLARCVEVECGITQSGLILGTPSYMSPEQVSGRRSELTASVDIYGLGAVLYKLLTGRPPFLAETLYEILAQVRRREPVPPRSYNRQVDRRLELICLKCLEKDPCDRYRSAAALARDLEQWAVGGSIAVGRPDRSERFARWYRSNRIAIAISAILVGLAVIFGLAGVITAAVICHHALAATDPPAATSTLEAVKSAESRGLNHREEESPSLRTAKGVTRFRDDPAADRGASPRVLVAPRAPEGPVDRRHR